MNPIITQLVKKSPNKWKAYIQGNESVFEEGENETLAIARLLMRLQGKSVHTWNGAFYLAAFSWLSVLVLPWLMLTDKLPADGLSWSFFFFFLIMGTLSGSYSLQK
jgi:hypothetical protein